MIFYILSVILTAGVLSFGLYRYFMYKKFKKEMEQYHDVEAEIKKDFGKSLVIYYSYSGGTRYIAEKIAKKVKADLYEIRTVEPYNSSKVLLTSKSQIRTRNYPAIEPDFPSLDEYDTIFIGSPVWWYTVAPAVFSYLIQTDFKGKKVAPFKTHGGNEGKFDEDFSANAKNAEILDSVEFFNVLKQNKSLIDKKISVWLNRI